MVVIYKIESEKLKKLPRPTVAEREPQACFPPPPPPSVGLGQKPSIEKSGNVGFI